MHRLLVYCLTVDGEGIDPSYVTTFVPLAVIPLVSRLTTDASGDREKFYALLDGAQPVERART